MGQFLPFFAITVGLIITVVAILSDTISKYKLKAEQIKADALVRAEEVRTRNQLELERMMRQDEMKAQGSSRPDSEEAAQNPDYAKSRGRVRE